MHQQKCTLTLAIFDSSLTVCFASVSTTPEQHGDGGHNARFSDGRRRITPCHWTARATAMTPVKGCSLCASFHTSQARELSMRLPLPSVAMPYYAELTQCLQMSKELSFMRMVCSWWDWAC
jgi:hypothetical protein